MASTFTALNFSSRTLPRPAVVTWGLVVTTEPSVVTTYSYFTIWHSRALYTI